jgi:hypothetical protein
MSDRDSKKKSSSSRSKEKSSSSSRSSRSKDKASSSSSSLSVASASVRDLVKTRLIGLFDEFSQNDENWKVLIVDDESLKVISVACRVRDVMQKNITSK